MKTALKINWILTTLLSIATGLFKVMQQEADLELFAAIGMNATATTLLGIVQLLAGLLLIPHKTRKTAAWAMLPTYTLASVAVFVSGMAVFGIISLLFIAMSYGIIYMEKLNEPVGDN